MIDKISQAEGVLMNTIQSKSLIGIGALLASICVSVFSFFPLFTSQFTDSDFFL